MEQQLGRATSTKDLDITPEHAARVPGAECLHGCFLSRKARSKRRSGVVPAQAVRDLVLSEHTEQEPIAEALDRSGDTRNLSSINARPYNFHLR